MPTNPLVELARSNEKLRVRGSNKAFTFSAIRVLKRGPSLAARRGARLRPVSRRKRKAESDQCSNSVLSHSVRQFRFPKRNSVDATAIGGPRAYRVQAELVLSIGRYG